VPRYIQRSTIEKRRQQSRSQQLRNVQKWVDPFPEVHGTLPEKMVYAALSRLGIPFLFLNDKRFNIPEIEFDKTYQADFIIESVKLIIEVQGAFWHSKPKTVEADAYKMAVYEYSGYKVLAWWDYDIIGRLNDLITAEPLLLSLVQHRQFLQSTELPVVARSKVDTSKGIRTLNRKRHQPGKTAGTMRRSVRKARSLYATAKSR
jgi:very-short-patch-repair endonuclease